MTEEVIQTDQTNNEREERKGINWGMVFAWIFVIALLILVGAQLAKNTQESVVRGDPAPLFSIVSFDDEEFDLGKLRGKVVLINFWASWCVPCEDEAQELQEAWEYYQDRGDVIFLGIDYSDTETRGLAFIRRFGITYPNAPDLGTKVAQLYRIQGVPETFIVDKNGNLSFILVGPFQSAADIIAQIDPLLDN